MIKINFQKKYIYKYILELTSFSTRQIDQSISKLIKQLLLTRSHVDITVIAPHIKKSNNKTIFFRETWPRDNKVLSWNSVDHIPTRTIFRFSYVNNVTGQSFLSSGYKISKGNFVGRHDKVASAV